MESVKTTVRILYNGNIKEKDIKLRSFSIGRSSKDDITVDSDRVSRAHVKVKVSSGQILVSNNHATNGTFLNGTALPAEKWYKLKEGATLNLGGSQFDIQVFVKDNVIPIQRETQKKSSTQLKTTQQESPSSSPRPASHINKRLSQNAESAIVFSLDEKEEYDEAILQNRKPDTPPQKVIQPKDEKKQAVLEELEEQSKQLLEQEGKELQEHLDELYEKEKELYSKLEKSQKKLDEIEEKVGESKTTLEELDDNLIHTHEKFLEQENFFKNKQKANKELIKEIDEKRQEHNQLLEELEKDSADYEVLQTDLKHSRAQLDKTHRQIDELKSEQVDLEEKISKLKKQKEDLELHVHQQNILIDRQNNESKSYERQIESTLEELKHINEREAKTSHRIDELHCDIKELEKSKHDYVKEIDTLHAESENVRGKLINLQRELESKKIELQNNEKDLEASKQKIILQAQATIEKEREVFNEEIASLREKEDLVIAEKKHEANRLIARAEEELSAAESKYQEVQEEIRALQDRNQSDITSLKKEAEEQAEQILLDAQDELEAAHSEYQKGQEEIKALMDKNQSEIASLKNAAENEASLIKKSAQDRADQIESNARDKENSIIESARNKAQDELDHQNAKAEMIVQQAEVRAQQIQNEGQKDLQEAKELLNQEISQLHDEKNNIQEQIKSCQNLLDNLSDSYQEREQELQKKLDEKDREITEQMTHAKERNIKKMNSDIDHERSEKLKELNDLLDKTRQDIETEKSQARENLAKMRANELEQIRQMRAQEKAEIERNKKHNIDDLSEGIENLLKNQITQAQKNQLSLADFYIQTDNIKQLVKEAVTTDQDSSKPLLEKLNPYGLVNRGKSVKVTRNIIIGSIASLLIITSFFVFPGFYSGIANRTSSLFAVEQTAEGLFIQDLRDLRKQQADLQLDKSPGYKNTYVDNILYTTDFEMIWLSDDFYRKWVVKLDEVASMELGLRERMMMEFISLEFRLMQELVKLRASTTRDLFNKHLEVMRELEKEKRAEMVETLGGKDILDYILLAQRRFYDDFIENNPQVAE